MTTSTSETGATMQPWASIAIGDLVRLKDRKVWQCIDRHGDVVKVEREDGRLYEGQPTGDVEVVATADEDMAMAIATTQIHLGGLVIAQQDGEGRWLVPVTYPDVGSLLTHLYTLHGVKVNADSLREGHRKHEWLHRPENKDPGLYQHHYHDPHFYRERAWEPGRGTLVGPK